MGAEVQFIDQAVAGQEIPGPVLRSVYFTATGAFDHGSNGVAVAFTIVPLPGDPVFKEPVIVMVAEKDVELVVKLLRTAVALMPADARKGGEA